ncbi:hypothetical protein [Prevotella falsenii]|uniref:hypothetical protein n=1 Tax=Prevotella falsenii TaxID=515414 RepID=UPI00056B09A3|nr:hypothetical protein [Prevotella falsenii]
MKRIGVYLTFVNISSHKNLISGGILFCKTDIFHYLCLWFYLLAARAKMADKEPIINIRWNVIMTPQLKQDNTWKRKL